MFERRTSVQSSSGPVRSPSLVVVGALPAPEHHPRRAVLPVQLPPPRHDRKRRPVGTDEADSERLHGRVEEVRIPARRGRQSRRKPETQAALTISRGSLPSSTRRGPSSPIRTTRLRPTTPDRSRRSSQSPATSVPRRPCDRVVHPGLPCPHNGVSATGMEKRD